MKRDYFKFDMLNNTIVGSAENIRKAGDPNSPQYKALCAMKKQQPTFTVAVRQITRNKDKETWDGLSIKAMRTFVEGRKDEEALTEFNALCAEHNYPYIKSWFVDNYKGIYKKTENKKAMTKAKIRVITHKDNVVPLSADKVEAQKKDA